MPKRILAFDFGLRRIGVAVGNTLTRTSQGIKTLNAIEGRPDIKQLTALINEWRPDLLVVGLPLNLDNSESETSSAARAFGEWLGELSNKPIEYIDERLSTLEAESLLQEATPTGKKFQHKRKKVRDQLAAELILATYFEDNRG